MAARQWVQKSRQQTNCQIRDPHKSLSKLLIQEKASSCPQGVRRYATKKNVIFSHMNRRFMELPRFVEFPNFTEFTDSDTQALDDMPHLERTYNSPPSRAPECNSFKWKVQVIDNDGTIEGKMVTSRDVWKLENSKVIVHFDEDTEQPVDDSGGLLGSWLGQLSNDVNLLPINYSDWRLVNSNIKDRAWEVIQTKFWFDDAAKRKHYVMGVLGSRCKDVKLCLWREYKRDDRAEMIRNRSKKVPEEQWFYFVCARFTDKWKKMQNRNKQNQKNHTTPHLCGRKSFARKRNEITIKNGKPPSQAELFVATRTKSDGSYVSDEAKTRANSSIQTPSNVRASLDDEYAQVFGPKRPGRVRCVGRGPTPSKFLRRSTGISSEFENSEIAQLEIQNKVLQDHVTKMNTLFQKMFGVASVDQASTCATNFAAAFANIPNPPSMEVAGSVGISRNLSVEDHGGDQS